MKKPLAAVLRRATSPAVLRHRAAVRLLQGVAGTPMLPPRARGALAHHLRRGMIEAGWAPTRARTALASLARIADPFTRAQLLMREVTDDLSAGRTPAQLDEALDAELTVADRLYERGDRPAAARCLHRALRVLFHRALHFDRLTSPLAEDPASFLAPLYGSTVGRALRTPRGRQTPPASAPVDRPTRLLVLTNGNPLFLREINERYATHPAVELRYVHLADDPVAAPLIQRVAPVVEHLLTGRSPLGDQVEAWLRPHLDWADVCFVDWCVATAALVTLVDPGTTRIVLRLHSFEALSFWPHLVDFSRVDDLVLVSEHLLEFTTAVVPELVGAAAPRLHVIANAMDLHAFPRPKDQDARFTLGLVGVGAVAKDPRWAIEVLRLLRKVDSRYRLLLIGAGLPVQASGAVRDYHQALDRDIAEWEPCGAVVRVGQVRDVPEALTRVGVILSTSVRESFHCALVEGAASGAVPVVRDWPFFAGQRHGPSTLFPPEWVVTSPAEAVERILAETADDTRWSIAGGAASRHALDTWDWTVTARHFDALFGLSAPH